MVLEHVQRETPDMRAGMRKSMLILPLAVLASVIASLLVVGIPLARNSKTQGLLVLTFDAGELKNRVGITEQEFLKVDLNR